MREIVGMSVLVTGGGSGIGEGTARHLAGLGVPEATAFPTRTP